MKLIWLTWVNIKRLIKNPQVILMLVVLPVIMISFVFGNAGEDVNSKTKINIYSEDNDNSTVTNFINDLKEEFEVKIISDKDINEVYGMVEEGELSEVYYLDKTFGERLSNKEIPTIKIIARGENTGDITKKHAINEIIQKTITGKTPSYLIDTEIEFNIKENTSQIIMLILMVCYFMLLSGGLIAEDIIQLKDENILKRSITTANKDVEILGGLYLSIFIIQSTLTSVTFIVLAKVNQFKIESVASVIFVMILSSLFSTAVTMAAARWFKTKSSAELSVVIFGLITFVMSMTSLNMELLGDVPEALTNIAKISPFHWMSNILMGENIIFSAIIIILMSLCFFTAGTFRLRDFARD
ncbi:MAG: ABC transporter permease [Clostridium sp.]